MSVPVRVMTNDQLIQNLAIHRKTPDVGQAIENEILRKINLHGCVTPHDRELLQRAVGLLEQMEEIESEADSIDRPERSKQLDPEYFGTIEQLLRKMRGEESPEPCKVA